MLPLGVRARACVVGTDVLITVSKGTLQPGARAYLYLHLCVRCVRELPCSTAHPSPTVDRCCPICPRLGTYLPTYFTQSRTPSPPSDTQCV